MFLTVDRHIQFSQFARAALHISGFAHLPVSPCRRNVARATQARRHAQHQVGALIPTLPVPVIGIVLYHLLRERDSLN